MKPLVDTVCEPSMLWPIMAHTKAQKREHSRRVREERRAQAYAYLGGACAVCGRRDGLSIDHIDPLTKVDNVSRMWTDSEERFWAEVEKCQLLCEEQGELHRRRVVAPLDRDYGLSRYAYQVGYLLLAQLPAVESYSSEFCFHEPPPSVTNHITV